MEDQKVSVEPQSTKKCRMCGEDVLAVAVRCKHCKSDLRPEAPLAVAVPSSFSASSSTRPPIQKIEPGGVIGFSAITFGIYGLVKFYQACQSYRPLAGRASNFTVLFWVYLGSVPVLAFISAASGSALAFPAWITETFIGVMVLREALSLRGDALKRQGLTLSPGTGDTTQQLLWVGAMVPFVGIIPCIIQTLAFFRDHNVMVAASLQERFRQ